MSGQFTPQFITFEGGDGAGKSTQIHKLAGYLEAQGDKVLLTREPGGSQNGEAIRNLLLAETWKPMSELYLFLAARYEHVENTILPAMATHDWVLCDRFHLSTLAYQGYGGGLDIALIEQLAQPILRKIKPSATILLDIDPEIGLRRVRSRNVFDNKDIEYHRRVRQGFLEMAQQTNPTFVISAELDEEQTFQKILTAIKDIKEGY